MAAGIWWMAEGPGGAHTLDSDSVLWPQKLT